MKNNEIICKLYEKILYYNFKPALEKQLLDIIPAKVEMILEKSTLIDLNHYKLNMYTCQNIIRCDHISIYMSWSMHRVKISNPIEVV